MRKYVTTVSLGLGIDSFELKYFKTITQAEGESGGFYGAIVEKYVDGGLVEEVESGPLCEDEALIYEIIGQLAKGGVTPFVLNEILDEMDVLQPV
jgi:hypothetical protein